MNRGIKILFLVSLLGLGIAFLWNHIPAIKETAHAVLDPTLGALLAWSPSWGLLLITAVITLITTLLQKYTVDQALLREIKAEQKLIREQSKQFKDHPEKMFELNKKSAAIMWRTMDLTLRPTLYTAIPFILLIRWFSDYFVAHPAKIMGFMGWIWAYLLFAIILSSIFRKVFKLP